MSIGEKLKTTRLEIEKLEERLSILNRARITKLSRDLFDQRQGDREINKIRELVQEVLDRIRGSSSSAGGLTVSPASDLKVSEVMVAGRALAGLAQKMRDDPTGELVGLFEKFTKAVTELANRDARLWSTNHGADDAAPIADPVIETIEQVNDLQELLKKLQPESGDESGVENLRAVLADRDLRFKALMESIAAIQSNVASASDLLIAQVESFQALEHNIVRLSPQQATDLEAGKGQAQTHIGIMMQSHFEHLLTQLPADDSMVSAVDVSKDRFDGVTQFLSQDGRDRVSNLKAQVDAAIRVAEFLKPEVQVNTLQELKGVLERLGAKEVVAQALSNNEKLMTAMRTRMAQVMDPTVLEEVASQIEQFSQGLKAANAVEGIETILQEVSQFQQEVASVDEWLTVVLSAEKGASLIQISNFAALKTSAEKIEQLISNGKGKWVLTGISTQLHDENLDLIAFNQGLFEWTLKYAVEDALFANVVEALRPAWTAKMLTNLNDQLKPSIEQLRPHWLHPETLTTSLHGLERGKYVEALYKVIVLSRDVLADAEGSIKAKVGTEIGKLCGEDVGRAIAEANTVQDLTRIQTDMQATEKILDDLLQLRPDFNIGVAEMKERKRSLLEQVTTKMARLEALGVIESALDRNELRVSKALEYQGLARLGVNGAENARVDALKVRWTAMLRTQIEAKLEEIAEMTKETQYEIALEVEQLKSATKIALFSSDDTADIERLDQAFKGKKADLASNRA